MPSARESLARLNGSMQVKTAPREKTGRLLLRVGSGVYLYRLRTDAGELVGKMLLLR